MEAAAPGRPAAAMVGQTQERIVLRSVGLLGMVAGTAGVNVSGTLRRFFVDYDRRGQSAGGYTRSRLGRSGWPACRPSPAYDGLRGPPLGKNISLYAHLRLPMSVRLAKRGDPNAPLLRQTAFFAAADCIFAAAAAPILIYTSGLGWHVRKLPSR